MRSKRLFYSFWILFVLLSFACQISYVRPELAPTLTPTFPWPVPAYTPAAGYLFIPVMPGALAGEGASWGYSFTIRSTLAQVRAYYKGELMKQGWELTGSGQADRGGWGLIFENGLEEMDIFITQMPAEDPLLYVILFPPQPIKRATPIPTPLPTYPPEG